MRSLCLVPATLVFAAVTYGAATSARADVLYDAALGSTPGAQGWTFAGTGGTETPPGGSGPSVTLDTSANALFQAGYSRLSPFGLDRLTGYTIRIDIQLQSESHGSNDRAGFSLIALGRDKKGIELGFWTDQIWAQNDTPLFTHGESAAFNTTTAVTRYDLQVVGDRYRLFAEGASTPLLSGALRDYTAFVGPINPYGTPNFLFLGDDTTSASARVKIGRVEVSSAVPEAGSLALVGAGALPLLSALVVRRRRRRRRSLPDRRLP